MCEVKLNVYDVTTAENESTNSAICTFNNITHYLGLGGVFHGAIEVYGEEWSFGYCESGTGVYNCYPHQNPLYTYRECISLGKTQKTHKEVSNIIYHLKSDWLGESYNLLQRNCCNFCDAFSKELKVANVPGWLNRFATGADAAITFSEKVSNQMSSISSGIQQGSQMSMSWIKNSFKVLKNQGCSSAVSTSQQRKSYDDNGAELEVQLKNESSVFFKNPKQK